MEKLLNILNIECYNVILPSGNVAEYDAPNKTIRWCYVQQEQPNSVIENFSHELGHFIWKEIGFNIENKTGTEKYYEENSPYLNRYGINLNYDYINHLQHETIAESFRLYICGLNEEDKDNNINLIRCEFIEILLKKYCRNFIQKVWYYIKN